MAAAANAQYGSELPEWLVLRPGQVGIVGAAPWPLDTPEAALTGTAESAARPPDDYSERPADALGQPIGLRVRVQEVYGPVVRVRPEGAPVDSFTRLDFLSPEIPEGTRLVVAGGFGNYADFYPSLGARTPEQIATGTTLVAVRMGIAPFDPDGSEFVRVRVQVQSGPKKGRAGWIPVGYTGVPAASGQAASETERACRCRLVEFR
ncbi:MAG: hypothetical protein GIW95_12185 [Candidatus Eremiobacteraeota bacterium]|nr:hypothetical protein [Candidatus Eremiobacteraeota bacterium]